jgi:hypothetical protein
MQEALERYLRKVFGSSTKLLEFKRLGAGVHGTGFLIEILTEKEKKQYVIKDLAPDGLGHDNPSDRASVFLWALDNYNNLPKHIKAIDVIALHKDGSVHSVGGGKEYFMLMEKAEGMNYFNDLTEFSKKDHLDDIDVKKIKLMTSYLAGIHSMKKDSNTLYWRKLRDTVGHGECLMGVFDSYPDGTLEYEEMAEIVKKSVDWIAKLKPRYKRLSQIHGDFHPGNIWFITRDTETQRHGDTEKSPPFPCSPSHPVIDFILLDRSRGPWGDPADDITALTINYVFFSIKNYGDVRGSYIEGINLFFNEYIKESGDKEINEVVAPFFAFRGAVVANPIFYPELTSEQRKIIFRFVHNVLDDDIFRVEKVNEYLR